MANKIERKEVGQVCKMRVKNSDNQGSHGN